MGSIDAIIPDSEASGLASSSRLASMASASPATPPAPVHMAPKRTYARAPRPLGPTAPALARPAPALSPTDVVLSSTQENTVRSPSPAEERSPAGTPAWRRAASRSEAKVDEGEDTEEDDVDDDEVERAMAMMRGGDVGPPFIKPSVVANPPAPLAAVSALKGASSLNEASSSSLPPLTSSPSRRSVLDKQSSSESLAAGAIGPLSQSTSVEDETAPVRRAGTAHGHTATGKRRAVFTDDDEDAGSDSLPTAGPSSARKRVSPAASDEEATPVVAARRRRQRASPAESARDEDDAPPDLEFGGSASPTPAARAGSPTYSPDGHDGHHRASAGRRPALEKLARARKAEVSHDEDGAATPLPRVTRPSRRSPTLGSDASDVDEDVRWSGKGKNAKQVKVKGLAKKELLEMEKQQAEIRANKSHNLGLLLRDDVQSLSSFAREQAAKAQKNKQMRNLTDLPHSMPPVPALTRDDTADISSDMEATPNDEIAAFSSIRSAKAGLDGQDRPTNSSPVPFREGAKSNTLMLKPVRPASKKVSKGVIEDDDDDDQLPDVASMFEPAVVKSELTLKQKQEILALQKRKAALALAKVQAAAKSLTQADDELDIEKPSPIPTKKTRLGASASGVLKHEHNAMSESRRNMARMTGQLGVSKRMATESMQKHAGQEFAHAASRQQDGPYHAPGLPRHKQAPITAAQRDADLLARSRAIAMELARQKEAESGIKGKTLPQRSALALLASSGGDEREGPARDESEDEDGEYDPNAGRGQDVSANSDSDDQAPHMDEDIELALSGEDEEDEDADIEDIAVAAENGSDKENMPPAKRSLQPATSPPSIFARSTTHKRARVVDSDEEDDEVVPAPKEPMSQQAAVEEAPGSIEFELDGGFSQFFDATQSGALLNGEPAGFDALRHEAPPTLAEGNKLLPSFDLTSTALERDAALLQAELEVIGAAPDAESSTAKAPKQYLNQQGFFTQTKPASPAPVLDEDNLILDSLPSGPELQSLLSATYRSHRQSASPDGARPLRKLKARSMTPEGDDSPPDSEGAALEPTQMDMSSGAVPAAKPADAFATLMASKGEAPPPSARARVDLRQFVEDQADESDEEDAFGIGRRHDDEGEDDEDMDQPVEGLVDDQERTLEEQARDKEIGLAKLREIEAQDDKNRQDLATKLTEGKFRGRRRDGAMGNLDISDDDEDGSGRRRKKQRRRARELGKEDALAELPEDNAFRLTYEQGIASDDEDDNTAPIIYEDEPVARSPSSEPREAISRSAIDEQIRNMARQNREDDRQRQILEESQSMLDLDSDDDESAAGGAGFQIIRQRPAIKPSRPAADKTKRLQALLDSETPSDSRRAGGNSSVSQLKNAPGAAKTGSTFRAAAGATRSGREMPKKQSSMSSAVMVKGRGFE